VIEQDFVRALLGRCTHEIARGLMNEICSMLDPLLGFWSHTKLESG